MCKVYTRQRTKKNGCSWEWRFEAPKTGETRKQMSKSGYHSESEALAAGYAEYNKIKAEGVVSEASVTMNELLVEYTAQILFPGLAKGTADNYRALIDNHISPAIGAMKLSDLTPGIILDHYSDVRLSGVSQFPLNGIRRILSGAFEFATVKGYLTSNPIERVTFPKSICKPREKTAYTPQQIQMMSDALPLTNDRMLPFLLAAYTGMRESEIAGLQWCDVDMSSRVIHVRQQLHCNRSDMYFGSTKTGVVRDIPFGDTLAEILEDAKKRQTENRNESGEKYKRPVRLADGHVSYSSEGGCASVLDMVCTKADGRCLASWDFKAIAARIKNRFDPDFTFHTLRHSHATIALEAGAEIKAVADRLGHKDARTTLAVYAHVGARTRRWTADIIERSLAGSGDGLQIVRTA